MSKKSRLWLWVLFGLVGVFYLRGVGLLAGFSGNVGFIEVSPTVNGCQITYHDVNGVTNTIQQQWGVPLLAGVCNKECSSSNLCGDGEGDCDYDRDCLPYHRCVFDVGLQYGCERLTDVCVNQGAPQPVTLPDGVCLLNFETQLDTVRVKSGSLEFNLGLKGDYVWNSLKEEFIFEGFKVFDDPSDPLNLYLDKPLYTGTGESYTITDGFWMNENYIKNQTCVYECIESFAGTQTEDDPYCNSVCLYNHPKWVVTGSSTSEVAGWGDCVYSGFKSDQDVVGWHCNYLWQPPTVLGCYGSCMAGSGEKYSFSIYDLNDIMWGVLEGHTPSGSSIDRMMDFLYNRPSSKWSGKIYLNTSHFYRATSSTTPSTTILRTTTTAITLRTTIPTTTTILSQTTTTQHLVTSTTFPLVSTTTLPSSPKPSLDPILLAVVVGGVITAYLLTKKK